jgi:histidinol-phosphatase
VTAEDDLRLALELADAADAITMARHRAADLQVETKPDLTPVTESDRAVEVALREIVARERPGDTVIGEEFGGGEGGEDGAGGERGAGDGGGAGGGRRAGDGGDAGGERVRRAWIIDPIDGTKSYVRGMPTWSTLIALRAEGVVELGVVSMPALGRRWWARRGEGAFADGTPVHVSGVSRLSDAQMCWSGIEDWDAVGRSEAILSLGRACWRTRGIGDAWQYMLVAEGIADIALDPSVNLWDLAAVSVIVEEAGGRFTDLRGEPTVDGGSGLATNGLLHDAALAHVLDRR